MAPTLLVERSGKRTTVLQRAFPHHVLVSTLNALYAAMDGPAWPLVVIGCPHDGDTMAAARVVASAPRDSWPTRVLLLGDGSEAVAYLHGIGLQAVDVVPWVRLRLVPHWSRVRTATEVVGW